ncbi:hypothetical protein N7462_001458 [Penicillium macrosclerotiorum]|uniref:uncharacterized protein n=1 Tax=Penicillium macrosclerotiorum TaxID=303699 RepID=UPI002546FC53|nr:uncharacterized protein N7462_001458 [Penicillium macrosclerotiorum]KAJ5692035.1 hypothetical protein N7462_001458 [Penicillium macrosclerotiorum]
MSSSKTLSSPIKGSPADAGLGLSTSEMRILIMSIVCQETKAGKTTLDYERLGNKLGYTLGSVKVMYGNAKRKLSKLHGDSSIAPSTSENETTPTKAPKRPRKSLNTPQKATTITPRKRKSEEIEAEAGPEAEPETRPETTDPEIAEVKDEAAAGPFNDY